MHTAIRQVVRMSTLTFDDSTPSADVYTCGVECLYPWRLSRGSDPVIPAAAALRRMDGTRHTMAPS